MESALIVDDKATLIRNKKRILIAIAISFAMLGVVHGAFPDPLFRFDCAQEIEQSEVDVVCRVAVLRPGTKRLREDLSVFCCGLDRCEVVVSRRRVRLDKEPVSDQDSGKGRQLQPEGASQQEIDEHVAESDLPDGGILAAKVRSIGEREGVQTVVLCAQTEMELQEWPIEDANAYRADLGLAESGLQRLVQAGYDVLGLATFFTATGTKTVQAWAIPAGTRAPQAAGKVHSDMERGFIRAQVAGFEELCEHGSLAELQHRGLIRTVGKDYEVQDGDVIEFLFNV